MYPHPFDYNRSHWLIYLMPLALCALYLFASVAPHRRFLIREHRYVSCIWLLFAASGILFSRYIIGRSEWNHVCRGSLFILLTLPLLILIALRHNYSVRHRNLRFGVKPGSSSCQGTGFQNLPLAREWGS